MLVLYRIAVHSKGVADIAWFLKLVAGSDVIYLVLRLASAYAVETRVHY